MTTIKKRVNEAETKTSVSEESQSEENKELELIDEEIDEDDDVVEEEDDIDEDDDDIDDDDDDDEDDDDEDDEDDIGDDDDDDEDDEEDDEESEPEVDTEYETQSESGTSGIYEMLEEEINGLDIPDNEKVKRLSRLIQIRNKKVNIMLVGSTGAGKSSTVNALFNMEVAKVGVGVDPETSEITEFELDNLYIWDTPGLGDGIENDKRISEMIARKLNELDKKGRPLIDLVVVIMDASSRDLGTTYNVINDVLVPNLGKEAESRILLALNQSDIAMKGNHWDDELNAPDDILEVFLVQKAESVRKRVEEATNLNIQPICYCAGYKDDDGTQRKPYNLNKLLLGIVKAVPKEKRLALAGNINGDSDNWEYDDDEDDYNSRIVESLGETVWKCILDCSDAAGEIGEKILGVPGKVIGITIGTAYGAVKGFFKGIFS